MDAPAPIKGAIVNSIHTMKVLSVAAGNEDLTNAVRSTLGMTELDHFNLSPSPHAISTVGEQSACLVRVNPAYEALVGLSADRLFGTELVGRFAIHNPSRERRMYRLETEGGFLSERAVIQNASGRPVHVLISARRIRIGGEAFDIESFTDLTDVVAVHRQELEAVETIAYSDPVTGLFTRSGFEARMRQHIIANGLSNCAVAAIEIGGFHEVADAHGHAVSDTLLREYARRLQSSTVANSIAARIGDDLFALLIRDCNPPVHVLEQELFSVLNMVFEPVQIGGLTLALRAALGVAHADEALSSPKLLLALADERMYAAKATGQNVVMVGRTLAMGR